MTSASELFEEKGFREGLQKGRQEGLLEELRNNIVRLLSKGLSPEEVSDLLDADPNLVREIAADTQAFALPKIRLDYGDRPEAPDRWSGREESP